jgi:hypothetical protein
MRKNGPGIFMSGMPPVIPQGMSMTSNMPNMPLQGMPNMTNMQGMFMPTKKDDE